MKATEFLKAAPGRVRAALAQTLAAIGVGGVQNAALLFGAAAVSHGVGRIYAPLGEIVAGAFALVLAWLLARAAR